MGSRPLISGGLTERYPGLTGSVLFSRGDFGAGDVPQTRQRVIQKCSERAAEIIMGPIRIGVPVVFTSAVADHTVGAGGALCRFFHAPAKEILCFFGLRPAPQRKFRPRIPSAIRRGRRNHRDRRSRRPPAPDRRRSGRRLRRYWHCHR